jgi:hypothetical protein
MILTSAKESDNLDWSRPKNHGTLSTWERRMSNTRKRRILNRTSGMLQRPKQHWNGQPGNPRTQAEIARQQDEARKPRFQFSHKGGST